MISNGPLQSVPVKGGLIWKCPYERVQSQARALRAPRPKQAGCWLPKSEPGWCRGCTTLWSTGRPATASACLELILSTVTSALQPKLERDLISSLHQSYQTKHLSEVIGPRMPFTSRDRSTQECYTTRGQTEDWLRAALLGFLQATVKIA